MNLTEIKKLIKLVEESGIEELEVKQDDVQVRIRKGSNTVAISAQPAPVMPPAAPVSAPQPQTVEKGRDNFIEICSPMVGTFYRAPAPDADSYVKVGDEIKPGQVLCIIEAMKLMNEIEAEISGKIIKVFPENAQPIEYNQPLFLVEKA